MNETLEFQVQSNAQDVVNNDNKTSAYSVGPVQAHVHNGTDAPPVNIQDTKGFNMPRVATVATATTYTIDTHGTDALTITALASAITIDATIPAYNFQRLLIRIKDNGTARAITWSSNFSAYGVALPTTTVISKILTIGFIYDSVASKWGCVASAQQT